MEPNYYKILDCDPKASVDEIRKQYKSLALQRHPDKSGADDGKAQQEFALLNKAAKTLLDERERLKYDSSLLVNEHSDKLINDHLLLADFQYHEDTSDYTYDCRCCGQFVINKMALDSSIGHLDVDCDSCSLSVRVNISASSPQEHHDQQHTTEN